MAGDDSSSKKNEALSIPGRYQGPSAAAPYPLSRMAPAFDLVDIARQIQDSHQTIATMTEGKLKLLADQMRAIQEKAQTLLEKASATQSCTRCRAVSKKGRVGSTTCIGMKTVRFGFRGWRPTNGQKGRRHLSPATAWMPICRSPM